MTRRSARLQAKRQAAAAKKPSTLPVRQNVSTQKRKRFDSKSRKNDKDNQDDDNTRDDDEAEEEEEEEGEEDEDKDKDEESKYEKNDDEEEDDDEDEDDDDDKDDDEPMEDENDKHKKMWNRLRNARDRIRIPPGVVPYYVDASCGKRFYDQISVLPPVDNYSVSFQKALQNTKGGGGGGGEAATTLWSVRVGDLVIVHLATDEDEEGGQEKKKRKTKSLHGKKRARKTTGDATCPYAPFRVAWAPCEVVCIWENGTGTAAGTTTAAAASTVGSSTARQRHTKQKQQSVMQQQQLDLTLEVRWFYRLHDIPGAAKARKDNDAMELLETDHVSECGADCLLAPARLHATRQQAVDAAAAAVHTPSQMPLLHYYCQRFWSVHRKAPVPFGSLQHRQERGWMHSRYLGKIPAMQLALREQQQTSATRANSVPHNINDNRNSCWQDAFRRATEKLSLVDASAEAHIHGTFLIGRDDERAKVLSFLRSAIQTTTADSSQTSLPDTDAAVAAAGRKCVMFIAGPPGTGKTATVKSVIAQLRQEQAAVASSSSSSLSLKDDGVVPPPPPFDFVYLNGMELRHPFDAYVKLWQAVGPSDGGVKPLQSAGASAALLEQHFGTSKAHTPPPRPVTVLLLDEIDFLVTKKQTLLYNLFDWPWRCHAHRRLIVLGISNTINLPDRLKPSVQSRLGGVRCFFQAYSVQETMNILQQKLDDKNNHNNDSNDMDETPPSNSNSNLIGSVFERDAVVFAARKTAVLSGDIRKAFQICKTAAEQVLAEHSSSALSSPPVVRIAHVQKASRDIFNSQMSKAIASASSFEALVLVSLVSLRRQEQQQQYEVGGAVQVSQLLDKMQSVGSALGEEQYSPCPNGSDLLGILVRLSEANLVVLHAPTRHSVMLSSSLPLISIRVDESEVEAALRNTNHRKLAEKQLAKSTLF